MPDVFRRDDRARLEQWLESGVQSLLRCGLLDDRLEDQVTVAQRLEIVVEIPERDERRTRPYP